jgi:hypothetical protein
MNPYHVSIKDFHSWLTDFTFMAGCWESPPWAKRKAYWHGFPSSNTKCLCGRLDLPAWEKCLIWWCESSHQVCRTISFLSHFIITCSNLYISLSAWLVLLSNPLAYVSVSDIIVTSIRLTQCLQPFWANWKMQSRMMNTWTSQEGGSDEKIC